MIGKLTVTYGRVTFTTSGSATVTTITVEGVAALDLVGVGTMVNHFFDCESNHNPAMLVWEKESGQNRFPTVTNDDVLRLDMSPVGAPVDFPDLDIYTCRDILTGEAASINVTEGMCTYTHQSSHNYYVCIL